jgi:hypothetical protein
MKAIDIITIIFSCGIMAIALIVILTNIRKKGMLGYFTELKVGADGVTYQKFSSTTLLSFLSFLFWVMGDLIFIDHITAAPANAKLDWQFSIVFMLFNLILALAVFAPNRIKELDYNKLIGLLKPSTNGKTD